MSSSSGRFVWREFITPNPTAAVRFYQDLFGWSAKTMEAMPYTVLHNDALGEDVGGSVAPPMEGVPSHWLDYITVDDVDAAMAQVTSLGGTVIVPAMSVPGIGRFGIAKDPGGAVFAPFKGETPGATDTERKPPVGTFCWSQLMTRDLDRVVPFYGALFGWTPNVMPNGVVVLNSGETMRATVMAFPEGMDAPSHWLQYVAVDDADAAFAKAVGLGATAYKSPEDIPGMGRFAVLGDPTGAVFAVWRQA